MPTLNQLIRIPRHSKTKKIKNLALKYQWNSIHGTYKIMNKPQVSGMIKESGIKIYNPTKPNSGNRQCARVILKNKKTVTAYIPGQSHNLQSYSTVLIKGGGAKDLIGVRLSIVRGNRDTQGVKDRKQGRSLYGSKKK